MRIAIDGRFISHPQRGGFKTYTENLVRHLAQLGGAHDLIVYLDRPLQDTAPYGAANVRLRVVGGTLPQLGMPWREQASLPLRAWRDGAELLHFPCQTGSLLSPCPAVVTIHDIIWDAPAIPERRSLARLGQALYARSLPRLMISRAAAIITVSEATRRDLVERIGAPPERIFVTHEAPNPLHRPWSERARIQDVLEARQLPGGFILALGSADPRKNLGTLVEAYAMLGEDLRHDHPLVIAWCHSRLRPELERQVGRLGLAQHVRSIGDVPDRELTALYNAASLFAFPSRYEGFGLPPLEAMACGTPVVAGRNSSLPEVLGDAALLVDVEHGPAPLAWAMASILLDKGLREALSARGLQWARRYSWERCAAETLAVYESVAARLAQGRPA